MKDSTCYVRDMLRGTNYGARYYRMASVQQAEEIKAFLNNPENTRTKSVRALDTGLPYWNEQEVDYVASNLGRGFLWYFICGHCGHRAKYLYQHSLTACPLCRPCLGIDYERRNVRRRRRPDEYPYVRQDVGPTIDSRRKKSEMAQIIYVEPREQREQWWI